MKRRLDLSKAEEKIKTQNNSPGPALLGHNVKALVGAPNISGAKFCSEWLCDGHPQ